MVLDVQLDNNFLIEKALATLQDGVAILEKDSTIVYVNREGQQIFERKNHLSPKAGDKYFDFVSKEYLPQIKKLIERAFDGHTATFTISFPQFGKISWFEMMIYPILDDTTLINHICLRVKNITDKVLLENQLDIQRQRERRKIIKATIDAQEKERSDIGKELHDNINQTLTTVKLYNEIVLEDFQQNKTLLEKSIRILNNAINEIRQLSKQLTGPESNTFSLKDLIAELAESINIMQKVNIQFRHRGLEALSLPKEFKTGIFRIVQEQINNTLKHAKATKITILILNKNGILTIRIVDNGIGFNVETSKKGVGLINMISRTEALGGTIDIQSQPGKGCQLFLEFTLGNTI
jgi:signal transduction histidine kinase